MLFPTPVTTVPPVMTTTFITSLLVLFLCTCGPAHLAAQSTTTTETGMYMVSFKDKNNSPFSVDRPDFLSERALLRRAAHQAPVTERDLPPNPEYIDRVAATGATIWQESRWMNGVVVAAAGPAVAALRKLKFVGQVQFVAPVQYSRASRRPELPTLLADAPDFDPVPVEPDFYGYGWNNLDKMEGDSLHRWGYRGEGMLVAVFDGGFPHVQYKDFLGHHRAGQVPAGYDLVEQDSTVHDGATHGATVLSTMAAHHPFFYVGTAPDARYVLFKTENSRGEHRLEEINYAIALEIAEALGVDVVNSSLGYTTFGQEDMNYEYKDMDGQTSPASRSIARAFARGMIVVTSAGNSGGNEWKYISVPADAPDVFAVGALNADGSRAYFSSFGPTADGRIKPDVAALGVDVAAVTASGRGITGASGTSLASPLVSGLIACLWQAVPDATNREILDAVRQTADQADAPDAERGYGRPNFAAAYRRLTAARK